METLTQSISGEPLTLGVFGYSLKSKFQGKNATINSNIWPMIYCYSSKLFDNALPSFDSFRMKKNTTKISQFKKTVHDMLLEHASVKVEKICVHLHLKPNNF